MKNTSYLLFTFAMLSGSLLMGCNEKSVESVSMYTTPHFNLVSEASGINTIHPATTRAAKTVDTTPVERDANHVNEFLLELSSELEMDASVHYHGRGQTATEGEDYFVTPGTATIPAGDTQTWIEVTIIGDNTPEDDEDFELVLSNPVGGRFPDNKTELTATHTILDDDHEAPLAPYILPVDCNSCYIPLPLTTWQWQLSNTLNTSYNVALYDIDLFDTPESLIKQLQDGGKKVICYFSAGSHENWREDSSNFPPRVMGKPLDEWPGERWLDIRDPIVHNIMRERLELAKQKGCNGVEPDNMDSYLNDSGFQITALDQLAYNRFIANEAHRRKLSVGLKNDLEQIEGLVNYYDFAVNEQCFEFSECDALSSFISNGKAVLNAEYSQEYIENITARDAVCESASHRQFSTLILPEDLDDAFRFSCL